METIWFCLIAVMIAMYVLLDGFDLGAGIIHLGVAHTDAERRQVLGSIGPCGTAMKSGCSRLEEHSISRSRRSTHPGSADFIFR